MPIRSGRSRWTLLGQVPRACVCEPRAGPCYPQAQTTIVSDSKDERMVTDTAERIMYLVTLLHYVASFVAGVPGIMW